MNLLEVHQVTKNYSNHIALKSVSLKVPTGSIYGLLGPNGAGKTSLIRIINQITAADEGYILLGGEKLHPGHIAQIGYLPEERGLYKKMKVGEQLIYLARLKGLSSKEASLRLKDWMKRFEMTAWWEKPIEDLSKGMQQKVQFVATVLHEPRLIILDEPFSGFDPINANLIKDEILRLRERGATIIFSTHRMESVEELCDNIALINKSEKILEGKKKEIKEAFKTHVYVVETDGPVTGEAGMFEMLESTQDTSGIWHHRIRLLEATTNTLALSLTQQASLILLKEDIPSMNEIFIRSVSGEKVPHFSL